MKKLALALSTLSFASLSTAKVSTTEVLDFAYDSYHLACVSEKPTSQEKKNVKISEGDYGKEEALVYFYEFSAGEVVIEIRSAQSDEEKLHFLSATCDRLKK